MAPTSEGSSNLVIPLSGPFRLGLVPHRTLEALGILLKLLRLLGSFWSTLGSYIYFCSLSGLWCPFCSLLSSIVAARASPALRSLLEPPQLYVVSRASPALWWLLEPPRLMVSFLWPLGPIVSFVQPPRLMVFIIASPTLESSLWPPRLAHEICSSLSGSKVLFFGL